MITPPIYNSKSTKNIISRSKLNLRVTYTFSDTDICWPRLDNKTRTISKVAIIHRWHDYVHKHPKGATGNQQNWKVNAARVQTAKSA